SHGFDGLSSAVCPPFAIQSTRGLKERCAYESVPQGDCSSHANCAGRHPGRCVYDSRSEGIPSFPASQEGELDGSLCASRSCGSTALADSGDFGGLGTVGGGEAAWQGSGASIGAPSRPRVLAVPEAGSPFKNDFERKGLGIAAKGERT